VEGMELICGKKYNLERATAAATTCWAGDAVHPTSHTYAKMALHLLEAIAPQEATGLGGSGRGGGGGGGDAARSASALTAIASPCRKTTTATLSDPGTGRNRGGISPCLVPASVSTVAPITPTPQPAAKAALLASSEGEAAAATTASRPAAAEGPITGAGCPAANAATNPVGSGSYGSEIRSK
jgi:hypothetical protein